MKNLLFAFPLLFILGCCACNGDSREHLVLLDSVPVNDSFNAYWFTQRGGIPANSSGGYLSIARSSKEISKETACFKTGTQYYTMGVIDSILVVKLYTDNDWHWLEGNRFNVEIEVTSKATGLPNRPELHIRPYDNK